jgi:DNA-binding MarR family transcriptional regulator
MSDTYFKLLIETNAAARLIGAIIRDYAHDNFLSCNVKHIIILHILIKKGRSTPPHEVYTGVHGVQDNNHANFQALIKNGYVTQRSGKDLDLDKRCVYFDVTDKGKDLYKKLCGYISSRMKTMREELGWKEENFNDYFSDLSALQDVLKNK